MRIATFNINNVVRRLPNLLDWLRAAAPDVVCLQELKTADASFPDAALREAGYHAVWRGQRTWNGVAILARGRTPVLVRDASSSPRSTVNDPLITQIERFLSDLAGTMLSERSECQRRQHA